MKKLTSLFLLFLLIFSYSILQAERNRFYKADRKLQRVYEKITGNKLESAVDDYLKSKYGSSKSNNNVVVRFNGGGIHDRLYIGRKNTLEFLVKNETILYGMRINFEFSCTDCADSIAWVKGYGNGTPAGCPPGVDSVVKVHHDAFNGQVPWKSYAQAFEYPSKISLTGMIYTIDSVVYGRLPEHYEETVLYSMQIEIPEGTPETIDGFSIDNICIEPSQYWEFMKPDTSYAFPPDFQGISNASTINPDAPPVTFDIVKDRLCSFDKSSQDPNIYQFKDGEVIVAEAAIDLDNFPGLQVDKKGDYNIRVTVYYNGDRSQAINDIKNIGIQVINTPFVSYIHARLPITLLPSLCQLKCVEKIRSRKRASFFFNYSGPDVNYYIDTIQNDFPGITIK